MERDLRLETERLALVPFDGELIAAIRSRGLLSRALAAEVPEGWPDDELSGLLEWYAPWVAEDSERLGYGPWFVIARRENSVVGSAGFIGTPSNGAIELGFGVHPDFRNRGYAAEAAQALVDWGLAQPSVEQILARCDCGNAPSIRVLEKIGMINVDEQDGMLRWTSGWGRREAAEPAA